MAAEGNRRKKHQLAARAVVATNSIIGCPLSGGGEGGSCCARNNLYPLVYFRSLFFSFMFVLFFLRRLGRAGHAWV